MPARCSAHFLPKFDNAGDEARLAGDASLAGAARCLAVSKKHSGHLVMCPPFYSKNGCGNAHSRMGEVLLRAHFRAAWERGEAQFDAWWAHSEANGLCYCFECVVPRLLGDHGATPRAAYMVLTCVSHTAGGGGFLSPAQLLSLGAAWRLPLNEVWYVPWRLAHVVEDALHERRWTLADDEVDALMAEATGGGGGGGGGETARQLFLSHGETQGPVLEGFVLMALDISVAEIAPLVSAYEASVSAAREPVLGAYVSLGRACAAREPWLLTALETPSAREPVKLAMGADAAWRYGVSGADMPLSALFTTLKQLYSHRVRLKAYEYTASHAVAPCLQLQIEVGDDQVRGTTAA